MKITQKEVDKFAKRVGYECAEYHIEWKGYSCYELYFKGMEDMEIGWPQYILIDSKGTIRLAKDEKWGIEINKNEDSETIGYGCIVHGKPGTLSINRSASYSAWLHEFQHVKDDKKEGWNGVDVLFDEEKHIAWEKRAYQVEIDLAKSIHREDIVGKLEENLKNERQRIKRLFQ